MIHRIVKGHKIIGRRVSVAGGFDSVTNYLTADEMSESISVDSDICSLLMTVAWSESTAINGGWDIVRGRDVTVPGNVDQAAWNDRAWRFAEYLIDHANPEAFVEDFGAPFDT